MFRSTGRATVLGAAVAAGAALGVATTTSPALAEAVVYETKRVTTQLTYGTDEDPSTRETAHLDVPTGYDRARLNPHKVVFYEPFEGGRAITVDLAPRNDRVSEVRAQRARVAERYGDSYRELAFRVDRSTPTPTVRWRYSFAEPGTGDTEPLVSMLLTDGNRVSVVGRMSEREHLRPLRNHVMRSVEFSR